MQNFLALISCAFWAIASVQAQTNIDKPVIQPTIMVIPFVAQGASLRGAYESNELTRIAITKVKEGFDNRGVNTIDLRAKLKATSNSEVLQEDQKADIKDEVIKLSGADVYVEVEAKKHPSASGNSASVIMTAYDAFSGESLANKVSASQKFNTDNYEKLVEKAVEDEIENFLNAINGKFSQIIEQGRSLTLTIGIASGSKRDFDQSLSDGNLLSDAIEDWVAENSLNGYYHLQGTTKNKVIYDLVKVPLRDTSGKNYRVSVFVVKLKEYLASLGIESERTVSGNSIVVTIK